MSPIHLLLAGAVLISSSTLRGMADETQATAFLQELGGKASQAEKEGKTVVVGKEGWLFFAAELKSLGIAAPFWGKGAKSHIQAPEGRDSFEPIVDFKDQLLKAGIELILVPVPAKAIIYPEMVSDKVSVPAGTPVPRLDVFHQKFFTALREKGVKVVDLAALFLSERQNPGGPLFCRQDTHWSGEACVVTAKALAAEVKSQPWYAGIPKKTFKGEKREMEITGDLWSMLGDAALPKEKIALTLVTENSNPVAPWRESPVLLLGDSHNLVFQAGGDMHAQGAGLADQLAMELGFPVDLVAVRGSGATPSRKNLARRRDNLAGKKVMIWCFTVRELTEGQGWSKVKVVQ